MWFSNANNNCDMSISKYWRAHSHSVYWLVPSGEKWLRWKGSPPRSEMSPDKSTKQPNSQNSQLVKIKRSEALHSVLVTRHMDASRWIDCVGENFWVRLFRVIREQWQAQKKSLLCYHLCVPAESRRCVNILLLSFLGRRSQLGWALGRRRTITGLFWGIDQKRLWVLTANSLRSSKSTGPGSQWRLFIKCERRQSGFKINFHPLLLLLWWVSGYSGWERLD